eukprot:2157103-Prymnesium_polylepis.1
MARLRAHAARLAAPRDHSRRRRDRRHLLPLLRARLAALRDPAPGAGHSLHPLRHASVLPEDAPAQAPAAERHR